MEAENPVQVGTLAEIINDQIGIFLAISSRPVVLIQILVAALIMVVSWILPRAVLRRRKEEDDQAEASEEISIWRRMWNEAVKELLEPLIAIAMLAVVVMIFKQRGQPYGLLIELNNVIILWLFYRIIVMILYLSFGDASRPYRNRIVTPFFLILVLWQALSTWPGGIAVIQATISLGGISISISGILIGMIVFYFFIVIAWIVEILMLRTLPERMHVEAGFIESMATLTRYVILAFGILISLSVIGVNFTSLALVAGGLSVGIGIGLQDIISNFVSGLVLLFEQSLRPGDVVELDGLVSRVDKISLRATIVRTPTNEELIIPNNFFTTQQVKNLTKSERLVQLSIPIGVSYDSDPELVRRLCIETGLKHPLVQTFPPPIFIFLDLGDSRLDFELRVSITEPEKTIAIKSDIYYMIFKVFGENNIKVPFPQRDLNLGDGWESLALSFQSREEEQ